MDIVVTFTDHWTREQREQITLGMAHPYSGPSGPPLNLVWARKTHHAVAWANGEPIAQAGLVRADIAYAGRPLEVGGVGSVLVLESLRGRGLGRLVMDRVIDEARSWGLEHALLFCRDHVVGFYERQGWVLGHGVVRVQQPERGTVGLPAGLCLMARALAGDAPLTGDLEVEGLPF